MKETKMLNFIKDTLENMPSSWLNLTTHRLDIFDEKLAKTQFLEKFEILFNNNNSESLAIDELPTAYDYIR
ncbi:cystathionine beta-synthase, partial [Flavobacteriales bacterium]|nr:cystathionine beta-synthase [Flavobacteriales bacterium]